MLILTSIRIMIMTIRMTRNAARAAMIMSILQCDYPRR